jgi:tetratricopeptide (TPR) repeat protein
MSLRKPGWGSVAFAGLVMFSAGTAAYVQSSGSIKRSILANVIRVNVTAVPLPLEQSGLKAPGAATRVAAALRELQAEVETALGHDTLLTPTDQEIVPQGTIPFTSLAAGSVARVLRRLAGRKEIFISGDVVGNAQDLASGRITLTFTVTLDGEVLSVPPVRGDLNDLHGSFRALAKALLPTVNPYLWAKYLADHDRRPEALGVLREMLRSAREPRRMAEIYNLQAVLLSESSATEAVVQATFNRAIEADRSFVLPYLNLGERAIQDGRLEDAKALLKRGVTANPHDPRLRVLYGHALVRGGARKEAAEQFRRATLPLSGIEDLLPFTAGWFDSLRLCSSADYDSAADAYIALADLAARERRGAEATEFYATAIDCNPVRADTYLGFAEYLRAEGRYEESIVRYRDVLDRDGRNSAAQAGWGFALNATNQPAEALPKFTAALQAAPDDLGALIGVGDALTGLCREPEALASYYRAVGKHPEAAWAHSALAGALVPRDRQGAVREYREAVRLSPDYIWALEKLGRLLLGAGQYWEALGVFERLVKLNPSSKTYPDLLAHARSSRTPSPTAETEMTPCLGNLSQRKNGAT